VALLFFKKKFFFHKTQQVLIGLPQGAGGLAIFVYFILV
jgi:hypothetical protein